ncbi:MAG: 3-oxoacyl-ACP reductase [Rhizorhabdus sp.]|nr:3-oxoacyl-ACP reductase [Rhizorhabdus sp.]
MSSLFSVAGKIALVTGGGGGIGEMIATTLVQEGVRTYIVGRTLATLERAAQEITGPGECVPLQGDLSTVEGARAVAAAFAEKEERLDILVNNAGSMYDAPLADFTEEGWDSVIDLNLKSVFFLTQALLPLLRASANEDSPAAVINIGSIGGLRIGPKENYSYQSAKAALHHLTGSLAKRLAAEHITVNAIAPGFFPSKLTPIDDPAVLNHLVSMVPRRRVGRPDDIGGTVVYLASRAASFVTGSVIPLEGGMAL